MLGFGKKEKLLGSVNCTMLTLGGTQDMWKPERGVSLVLAMFSLDKSKRIDFDSASAKARLSDGSEVRPIGLAACIGEDFRSQDGQRAPTLFATSELSIEQDSGDCFAYAYASEAGLTVNEVMHNGEWIALSPMPDIPNPGPGAPEQTQITALAAATLFDHAPFCDRIGMSGYSVYQPPAGVSGVRAVGPYQDKSIVSFRVDPEMADAIGEFEPGAISATLRDGAQVEALGLVIRAQLSPGAPPWVLIDSGSISATNKSLGAGGTATYLYDYDGPHSGFSPLDCKIVAAFPGSVTYKELSSIQIGERTLSFIDGTLVYDA